MEENGKVSVSRGLRREIEGVVVRYERTNVKEVDTKGLLRGTFSKDISVPLVQSIVGLVLCRLL